MGVDFPISDMFRDVRNVLPLMVVFIIVPTALNDVE